MVDLHSIVEANRVVLEFRLVAGDTSIAKRQQLSCPVSYETWGKIFKLRDIHSYTRWVDAALLDKNVGWISHHISSISNTTTYGFC